MPRPTLSDQAVLATREAMLDAAQALYEEGGLDAMSFRAIAGRVGCSHTKPYSYFSDKADLVDHLRLRAYVWLRDAIAVAASIEADPIDALYAVARAYVDAGVGRPRMYELLYSADGSMSEDDPALLSAKADALGVCERLLTVIDESGAATLATDPATGAHLLWVAAHGLVSLDHGGFLVMGRSLDQLMPVLFAGVTTGLMTDLEVDR